MCDVLTGLAAAGLAMSVGGTVMGAMQQRSVAQAQMNAQVASQQAQSQAFFQRMNAQGEQNVRDAATQSSTMQAETEAQQQLQQQQTAATQSREQQIADANQQTQRIGQQAQQAVQTAEQATSADAQKAAAAKQVAEIQALVAPGVSNISTGTQNTPTGPVAPAASTDNETASAIATRLAQAASATRDYATRQATVASAAAPLTLASTTTQNLGAETAPLAAQQRQVESSMPNLLLPSTVAYQNAGNYYKNLLNAIQARTQGNLNISKAIASGDITGADLTQADAVTQAQNQATMAQYNAAMNPTASILSGAGQLATFGAGAMGAFAPGSTIRTGLSKLGSFLGFGGGQDPAALALGVDLINPQTGQVTLPPIPPPGATPS